MFNENIKNTNEENRVLVTGGAGYLGSVLVPMLLEEGYFVHVLDRFYFGCSSLLNVESHPRLKLTNVDIFHHENIPCLFDGVKAVIHLASISNDPSGDLDPNLTIQTNFLATMSLARRAKSEKVKQFIFASSCSVYGASGDTFLDEESPVGPVTLYALSKLQCENELFPMADENFIVSILRFATHFGYSARMRFDLAVNVMTKRALQGKSIIINGDGKQYRPFLHVKDAARAIMHVIKTDSAKTNKHIFNVGDEKLNFTIRDLALRIQTYFPKVRLEWIDFNQDTRSYRVKFDRFCDACQFKTIYTIEDGLREIKEAYENDILRDMDNGNYYNLEVMKKVICGPTITYSLASSPRWTICDSLVSVG